MPTAVDQRITLDDLDRYKRQQRRFAMLTAYDYPTAQVAAEAGVPTLLVGDSAGAVVLGQGTTREVPLEFLVTIAAAVRRGAPHAFLVADIPYESAAAGPAAVLAAARRFLDEADCDAVKVEVGGADVEQVAILANAGITTLAHLGLRPQSVTSPEGYKVQARDQSGRDTLVADARAMVAAGARIILLEAVPPDASAAVLAAVDVPVIGCGAGPACDGHVVVTHDLLGLSDVRPPRFVPVHAQLREPMLAAMQQWVADIVAGTYPGDEHTYQPRR
jgi:3-methyl-2-oxobutanoate hydroxymethyltransferase